MGLKQPAADPIRVEPLRVPEPSRVSEPIPASVPEFQPTEPPAPAPDRELQPA